MAEGLQNSRINDKSKKPGDQKPEWYFNPTGVENRRAITALTSGFTDDEILNASQTVLFMFAGGMSPVQAAGYAQHFLEFIRGQARDLTAG